MYSLGILLWQLDSRSVPYAGQHPQVKIVLLSALLVQPVVTHDYDSGGDVPSGVHGGTT